jgi:hypothetical protein
MPEFDVTITAKVTKTLRITADNEDDACEFAHEQFNVNSDGLPEKYDQDTDRVVEVKTDA